MSWDRTLQVLALTRQGLSSEDIARRVGYRARSSVKRARERGLQLLQTQARDEAAPWVQKRRLEFAAFRVRILEALARAKTPEAIKKLAEAYARLTHQEAALLGYYPEGTPAPPPPVAGTEADDPGPAGPGVTVVGHNVLVIDAGTMPPALQRALAARDTAPA